MDLFGKEGEETTELARGRRDEDGVRRRKKERTERGTFWSERDVPSSVVGEEDSVLALIS